MANFSMKIASAVSATAIVASAMSTSLVSAASEFLPYAEALVNNKVIGSQSTEAGYRLNDQITRAELAKVAANLGQYTKVSCTGTVFKDVTASLGDLCDAIETLAKAGVISTANENFRPTANVTRAEMTKMLLGAIGEKQSNVSAGYADVTASLGDLAGFINRAHELKCANTATYFRPQANSSRGEAFKIASCAAKINVAPVTPVQPDNKPVVTNGSVTVAAVGTPAAQYVPANASSVNVGTFKITATGGDVVLNSVTIGRSGLGNSSRVTISVADKNGRISESRSVNSSSQEAVVRLNNPITLKNGESIELSALISVDTDVNAQHQFTLKAVNGSAVTPLTLGLVNTTSYVTSVVTVDSVQNYGVTSGRNDQTFARVTLRAGSQDDTISGFTLTKSKGVDLTRAFANVKVYRNGTAVGTAVVTSDKIIVSGLATDLARNNSAVYELRGDVVYVGEGSSANSSDTIVLNIAESEDVSATEKSTGFATQVKPTNQTGEITLSALDITTTRKNNSNNTVAPGTSNVMLIDGTISSQASFDITNFTLNTKQYPTNGTVSNVFGSLVLTINGVDYDLVNGNNITTGVAGGSLTFSKSGDKFRVEPGNPVSVQLRGSLLNNTPTGNLQYELVLNTAKNINNGNTTTLNSKRLTGNAITIQAPSITVKNSTVSAPSASKIFSNATDLEIGRFGVEAKADEVSVNKIVVTNSGTITDLVDVISNARLINVANGETVASNGNIEAGKITFNSVNLRVAKDTTVNVKLVVDTNSNLSTDTNIANRTFQPTVTIAQNDVSTSTAAMATVTTPNFTVTKTYTVSTNAPAIKVTALPLADNMPVARVLVTNTDENADLTLSGVELRVAFRSTANGNVPLGATQNVCLRNVGSSDSCGSVGTLVGTETSNGSNVYVYAITGSSLSAANAISKNNGTTEFEVFVPNAPIWVAGDNLSVAVNKVDYVPAGGNALTESYIGVNGASAVATK